MILITAFMWLISIEHTIIINFAKYELQTSIGIFAFIIFIVLWFLSIVMRAVHTVLSAPKAITAYREKTSHQKGMQALAYGLSAVAANDIRMAQYYTKRSTKYLKNDFGLNALLSALTARLSGDKKQSEKSFQSLLERKETSILGLKGLLQTAMDKGDYRYARVLIEQTLSQTPNQPWILNAQYDLELKTNHYNAALKILEKIKKNGLISKSEYTNDKSILLMLNNNVAKAYKLNPSSLPITLQYLKDLSTLNKRRKSLNVIKNQWSLSPHPQLLEYWIKYAPIKVVGNPLKMASWIEELYHINPQDFSSSLYCGEALISLHQKEQAQRFLIDAMERRPTIRTYQLMNHIDPHGEWLTHIQNAKADISWVCIRTGRSYDKWQPITKHGHFNSIRWMSPDNIEIDPNHSKSNNGLIDFIQS